jgi:hypothetical protein
MKRKKGKNRIKISFAATILVLSAVTVVFYAFSFRTPQYSIPSSLPEYGGLIGKYAPADSLDVSFTNFTAIRAINASAVLNRQLLNLVNPAVTVHYNAVRAQILVTVLNSAQSINSTATAALLSGGAYGNISRVLSTSSLTPDVEQGFSIYRVNDSSNGRTKAEWLTLVQGGSSVLFAEGGTDAKSVMLRMLSVWQGTAPSILSVKNVTRLLYPVSGTSHLAMSIENFTAEVLSSRMTLIAVDVSGNAVQLTHVVKFSSTSVASSQVSAVKSVYRFSGDFSQWEENVKAVQQYSIGSLQQAVALAGG